MITEIKSIKDVELFAYQITKEGVSFHPDDDFNDYINFSTAEKYYNNEDINLRNKLMNQSFRVCSNLNVDIYDIMYKVVLSVW